jgi:hypothetical protein
MKKDGYSLIFESTGRITSDNLISVSDGPDFEMFEGYDGDLEAVKPESEWKEYIHTSKSGETWDCLDQGRSKLTDQEKLELAKHMITVWQNVENTLTKQLSEPNHSHSRMEDEGGIPQ